ncbi:MAG: zinc-ribbon domain-containing protein [Myxococcales bacterium]|nr:zinc-ribbon domain-containing protein [Myxococcales bacterium]
MDVTCARCGTSYDFEEGLVSVTGTTVKCTNCGHLFKIHRDGAQVSAASDAPPRPARTETPTRWRIRKADGSSLALTSLAELPELIQRGEVLPIDEISHSGQAWKPLGEVEELREEFAARANSAPDEPRPARASMPTPPRRAPRSEAPPPPAPRRPRSLRPADTGAGVSEPPAAVSSGSSSLPPPPAVTGPRSPSPQPPATRTESAPPAGTAVPPSSPTPTAALPMTPRRSPWLWVGIALPLGLAAGLAGVFLGRASGPDVQVEPPARSFIVHGDEALEAHRPDRFQVAIDEYEKALAFHSDDAQILSALSRSYAVWSQVVREGAARARAAAQAQAEVSRSLELAAQAKRYGERAARLNPGNEEAEVALADALRLTGNLVAARAELDRARANQAMPPAETLRVAALLAIDEAQGRLQAGRALAQQAVAQDPSMIRARLLLGRCLLAEGDAEGARAQLRAVEQLAPGHPLAAELRARLDQATDGAAAGAPAAPPAGLAAEAPEPSETNETSTSANASADATQDSSSDVANDSEMPPRALVKRAERALERGDVGAAELLFERAIAAKPELASGHTGLGYVALERGRPRAALRHFRRGVRLKSAEALIGMGDSHRRLGNIKPALQAYRRYIQEHPRAPRVSIAEHQIRLLEEQLEATPSAGAEAATAPGDSPRDPAAGPSPGPEGPESSE